jgi:hypothetical protein
MPERITNANDALLPEIVHKHRVQRSASMTVDIGKSIQDTDCRDSVCKNTKNVEKRQYKYHSVVKIYNFQCILPTRHQLNAHVRLDLESKMAVGRENDEFTQRLHHFS